MLTALARTTLLVHDYDEALFFYRDLLGFTVLQDAARNGRGRLLHLGVPGQPDAGLWLRLADGPEERALVGRQGGRGPFLVLYATDTRALVAALAARGVRIPSAPREDAGAVVAHVEDPEGNELVIAQLPVGRAD